MDAKIAVRKAAEDLKDATSEKEKAKKKWEWEQADRKQKELEAEAKKEADAFAKSERQKLIDAGMTPAAITIAKERRAQSEASEKFYSNLFKGAGDVFKGIKDIWREARLTAKDAALDTARKNTAARAESARNESTAYRKTTFLNSLRKEVLANNLKMVSLENSSLQKRANWLDQQASNIGALLRTGKDSAMATSARERMSAMISEKNAIEAKIQMNLLKANKVSGNDVADLLRTQPFLDNSLFSEQEIALIRSIPEFRSVVPPPPPIGPVVEEPFPSTYEPDSIDLEE
jgi:hypothetical protein